MAKMLHDLLDILFFHCQSKWKICLQLMKPVTWPPLDWGVVCGTAASGNFEWNIEDVAKSIVFMLMSGPFLTGYTQTINDWYDREIDAINEPYCPIPSGAISESEIITQIWLLLLGGLGLGALLDVWVGHDFPTIFCLVVGGSFHSNIYSAPPLKLNQNGWIGNFALGSSYISLPWLSHISRWILKLHQLGFVAATCLGRKRNDAHL